MKDWYVIVSTRTFKVLGEDALEDKADVVLMIPVESLLDMVPPRLSMPYTGLSDLRFPEKGAMSLEIGETQGSSPTTSAL